ncbi:MAG: hydrogenase maturation protease [Acidobacteriota bacterium]
MKGIFKGEGMEQPRILIACIGNIFQGDDAFGVEVAKQLRQREMPDAVRVVDYGIRGFDLAYALMDGYDVTIFVDATMRGNAPGTLYVIEPDLQEFDESTEQGLMVEPHGMNPLKVLRMAHSMGAQFNKLLVVGCEPASLGGEEGAMGLSAPVQAAVGEAVKLLEELIKENLYGCSSPERSQHSASGRSKSSGGEVG